MSGDSAPGDNKGRKNRRGGRGQGQGPQERVAKGRPLEAATRSAMSLMRNVLTSALSPEAGIVQVKFSLEPQMVLEPPSSTPTLTISHITCKEGTDIDVLVSELETRLKDQVKVRPGEPVTIAWDLNNIKRTYVTEKEAEAKKGQPVHVLDKRAEPAKHTPADSPITRKLFSRLSFPWGRKSPQAEEEELPPDTSAAVAAIVKRVAGERDSARHELAVLNGKYDAVRAEIKTMRREAGEQANEIRGLKALVDKLRREHENILARRVADLEKQLQESRIAERTANDNAERALSDEKAKRKELETALQTQKGDHTKLLASFNEAHGKLHGAQEALKEKEKSRLKIVESLAAAKALEAQSRETIARLEAEVAEKSAAKEAADLRISRFQQMEAAFGKLQQEHVNLGIEHEAAKRAGAQPTEQVSGASQQELEDVRSRLENSEREREALAKAHDRFATILRRLAIRETTSVEKRDEAIATLKFLSALAEDKANNAPLTATNAVLKEFEDILGEAEKS